MSKCRVHEAQRNARVEHRREVDSRVHCAALHAPYLDLLLLVAVIVAPIIAHDP